MPPAGAQIVGIVARPSRQDARTELSGVASGQARPGGNAAARTAAEEGPCGGIIACHSESSGLRETCVRPARGWRGDTAGARACDWRVPSTRYGTCEPAHAARRCAAQSLLLACRWAVGSADVELLRMHCVLSQMTADHGLNSLLSRAGKLATAHVDIVLAGGVRNYTALSAQSTLSIISPPADFREGNAKSRAGNGNLFTRN